MLTSAHHALTHRLSWYRRWHEHPRHYHVHVGILVAVLLGAGLSIFSDAQALASPSPAATQEIRESSYETGFQAPGATRQQESVQLNEEDNAACQTHDLQGTLDPGGTRLYVNVPPNQQQNGWALTLDPTAGPTAKWVNAHGQQFSFNDEHGGDSSCGHHQQPAARSVWLAVDPSHAEISTDCATCDPNTVQRGLPTSFNRHSVDSVTVAQSRAPEAGRWQVNGVTFVQRFPRHADLQGIHLPMTITLVSQ